MFDAFCLGVVLAVGQAPAEPSLALPPDLPRNVTVPNVAKESPLTVPMMAMPATPIRAVQVTVPAVRTMPVAAGQATVGDGAPTRIPASLPTMTVPTAPRGLQATPVMQATPAKDMPKDAPKDARVPEGSTAPPGQEKNDEKKPEEPAKEPELGHFMKAIKGTGFGSWMEENNLSISGWAAGSYTYTNSPTKSSLPLTWNDRSDTFLFQQFWLDFSKNLKTDSKECDWGWKVAFLAGSDYRFTTVRGLFDSQLRNRRTDLGEPNGFQQNIYGADLPLAYANFWLPNLFEGTEVQVGRVFTPWGYESVMATATPLMSRSYAFNWAPPFFHTGVVVKPKFSDTLNGQFMIVNGNDVFFDGSDELRFVGALTKTYNDGNDSVTVAASIGRGAFNAGRAKPENTTLGLASEGLGRNNINVFDLVYTHKVNDDMSVAAELLYGYQNKVPSGATGSPGTGTNFNGAAGTAHWFSVVNYVTCKLNDKVNSILRFENFYDAEGQRTGFEGLYTATTLGLQIQLSDSMMFRPEVRYDINNYSNPFGQAAYGTSQRQNNLFSAGADLIIKY